MISVTGWLSVSSYRIVVVDGNGFGHTCTGSIGRALATPAVIMLNGAEYPVAPDANFTLITTPDAEMLGVVHE